MGFRAWVKRKSRKAKRDLQKAGKSIEKGGKQAVQEIDRGGKKAVKDVDRIADKSIDEIERAAKDVGNTIEREVMGVIDDVKNLANKAKRDIEGAANKIKNELEDVANKAEKEITDAANEAKKELERIPGEVDKAITETLPAEIEKAFQDCIDSLARAVTKEGLSQIRDMVKTTDSKLTSLAASKPGLVDEINNLGFSMEIGPVTLSYSGFYDRISGVADVLDTYVNHPPALRREPILTMIAALGPDTIDLGVSIQVVALVVGSKELGIGGSMDSIGLALFTELGDIILEKLGVPE